MFELSSSVSFHHATASPIFLACCRTFLVLPWSLPTLRFLSFSDSSSRSRSLAFSSCFCLSMVMRSGTLSLVLNSEALLKTLTSSTIPAEEGSSSFSHQLSLPTLASVSAAAVAAASGLFSHAIASTISVARRSASLAFLLALTGALVYFALPVVFFVVLSSFSTPRYWFTVRPSAEKMLSGSTLLSSGWRGISESLGGGLDLDALAPRPRPACVERPLPLPLPRPDPRPRSPRPPRFEVVFTGAVSSSSSGPKVHQLILTFSVFLLYLVLDIDGSIQSFVVYSLKFRYCC